MKKVAIPYRGDAFSGIFKNYYRKYGIDLENEKKIVCSQTPKTASYVSQDPCLIINNIGNAAASFWASSNDLNEYLTIDLKNSFVLIENYSLHSHAGSNLPMNWVLEGSYSGKEGSFSIIHKSNPSTDCFASNTLKTFATTSSVLVRYIRLRNNDVNCVGNSYFNIYKFEIFGVLYKAISCTIQRKKSSFLPLEFFSVLILST